MVDRVLITSGDAVASEIIVAPGALEVPEAATLLPPSQRRRRVAILTQPTVVAAAHRLVEALRDDGYEASFFTVPDREDAKTLGVAETCFSWLNQRELSRYDTIIGLGGGAATDLAGFVAATYLRGVEAVLVPTTLLGAVDAAIGGKTAVNVAGKNLVGVFRHPARVVIDTDVLRRLPTPLLREGAAEVLKAGLIADPKLVALYESDGLDAPLDDVVLRAVEIKAGVVSEDFEEHGRRAILNYGHTIGHGVETVTGLAHGHAVAVGMVAAGAVSTHVGDFDEAERQRAAIERLGLPTSVSDVDAAAVLAAIALDKKRDERGLRMVLLERIGAPVVVPVGEQALLVGLDAIGIR